MDPVGARAIKTQQLLRFFADRLSENFCNLWRRRWRVDKTTKGPHLISPQQQIPCAQKAGSDHQNILTIEVSTWKSPFFCLDSSCSLYGKRKILNRHFDSRPWGWRGGGDGGPVPWPLRCPDLTPLASPTIPHHFEFSWPYYFAFWAKNTTPTGL